MSYATQREIYNVTEPNDGANSVGILNTISSYIEIKGGTLTENKLLTIFSRFLKTGTNGTLITRFYINNTLSLSGATVIGTYNVTSATAILSPLERNFVIKTGVNVSVITTTANFINDTASQTNATTINVDWLTDKFIFTTVQCANALDTAKTVFLKCNQ